MEIKLNVTVELGQDAQKFVAGVLAGAIAGSAKEEKATPKANTSAEPATEAPKKAVAKKAVAKKEEVIEEEVEEEEEAPAPKKAVAKKAVAKKVEEEEEAPAPKKGVAKKPVAKKPVAKKTLDPSADEFEDLDADEQLEAIQKVVVRHTKRGKTADIRQLLGLFDVRKASELDEESYSQFYDLINRYAGGEEVEDIIEEFAE